MGDDVTAPNAGHIELPAATPLPEVLANVLRAGYLAAVSGGATWSVWTGTRLLATLHEPDFTRPRRPAQTIIAPGAELLQAGDLEPLYFDYHCAADPAEVLRNPQIKR